MLLALSSPQMMGRASSPLNPNAPPHPPPSSSSPMTSPTPSFAYPSFSASLYTSPTNRLQQHNQNRSHSLPSPTAGPGPSSSSSSSRRNTPTQTRYTRPLSSSSSTRRIHAQDLFTTSSTEGTTPTPMEGLLWKERFNRRMKERERRKERRQADLDKRRGTIGGSSDPLDIEDEEEADRRAQEDDEEIFRRLVVLQRRKANHATLVSHEVETGGSDPNLPEFWEDELDAMAREERELLQRLAEDEHTPNVRMGNARHSNDGYHDFHDYGLIGDEVEEQNEEDIWAMEAAQAEEEEREIGEAEVARRVEEALAHGPVSGGPQRNVTETGMDMDMDMDMDWDAFDSMDIE
ncbi:hypothetical protein CI109_106005 [Kwoniella shandongensis]|uniref:Uncharacterized protein n=1 Tax=Kwoniella shandongensis TaxID=1734106 RepID=A0A5M6BXV6_9TREE|nr:uncharacterized protein CI109_003947 [Kwoniella shandongensis]KAA5527688.1 hypothetical protein CI109_003947 [Kwoniella shandongensis]